MSEFQGWIANLSNGETVIQHTPNPGEFSAWRQLLQRLKRDSLSVTGLHLIVGHLRLTAASAFVARGYYQAYEKHTTMIAHEETVLQGIGAVVGDNVFITWAFLDGNPYETRVFQEIRPLAGGEEHTTLG